MTTQLHAHTPILTHRYIGCFFCLFFLLLPLHADTYWVAFTDKQGTTGRLEYPADYLSERALQRREKQGISIDSLDLPVSAIYRDAILQLGATLVHQSRWHNGITIEVNDSAIVEQIKACTFVHYIEQTQQSTLPLRQPKYTREVHPRYISHTTQHTTANARYSDVFNQMLHLDSLHHRGYKGEGIQIAVVDNGFRNVNQLTAFEQTNILDTKDFVTPNNSVYLQGDHGTMVLATMAAQLPNEYEGTATEASFYLLRTEDDATESIREVDAMVAAFEWADSVGADIITASLGYVYFDDPTTDYTRAMHNGKTLRNSIAATIAARKGVLVCISAGNEGNKDWHYISSPSDADSILTVGAVDEYKQHSYFSSYGPTADGRIKPEVCAMGSTVPVVHPDDYISYVNGTSFSCPITAGMAACLWSAIPELTNMQLRERIMRFASQHNAPDNILGYGIPNAWNSYLGENTATSVLTLSNTDWTNAAIYDLQGRFIGTSLESITTGIYLQKKNGVVRKIQVK